MADYDIFRDQLAIKHSAYGHALWDPSPGSPNRPVEVGDVGFIRRGKFHRLFNALLPADDESQNLGVPEYYERLAPNVEHHVSKSLRSSNHHCSAGVSVTEAELENFQSAADDFRRVSFTHSGRRGGAVLSLPVNAQCSDTLARSDFSEWIVKNIDRCFAFARRLGLGVENMEEIILVTGCDRTMSWTNVAFLEGPVVARASFKVKVVHSLDDNISIQFSRGHVEGALLNQGPVGMNLPEDQCIFIRGFRVARTLKIFPKRLKAAAGPSREPEGYDCEPDTEVQVISIPANSTIYRDPLHVLLGYIAERAYDCDMIIVHDDDLERIDGIGKGTSLDSLQPEVVMDLFRESNIEIHRVLCDLSPVNSSPATGTSVVCVAMLSMLSENWNIALPFQLFSNVTQNPGPSETSESPTPFPPTLSHGSSVAPIRGDSNMHDGTILRRLWHATKYFVTLVVQGLRSPSLCLGVIMLAIGYSVSDLWRSLRMFTHEERHRIAPTVVVTFSAVLFLGWIFSLTWLVISKLFVTLLLSIFTFALFLFEREHMRRQLDGIYKKIEFFQHHVTSNPAVPGLVAEVPNIIPVTAKTVPLKPERLRQRTEAEPTPRKNTGNTVEQSTIINLDGIPEQRAGQPGPSTESASSHIRKEIGYSVDGGNASPKLDNDSDSTSAEMQNTPAALRNSDLFLDILSTDNNGPIPKVLQVGDPHTPDLLLHGYISHCFTPNCDVEGYLCDLLKTNQSDLRQSYLALRNPNGPDVLFATRTVPGTFSVPPLTHDISGFPLWLLDYSVMRIGTVVPQALWSLRNMNDFRRYVPEATLQPPIFFTQEDGTLGLSLIDAANGHCQTLRGGRMDAHFGEKDTMYICILWPGYDVFKRQIQVREETPGRTPITIARFAQRVGRHVMTFLEHPTRSVARKLGDDRWIIGKNGIKPSNIKVIGAVQATGTRWMPILQLSNDV